MLLSILAHHAEAADPDLLEWIKQQLDNIFGLGPVVVVLGLGFVMLAIPAAILITYFAQRRRASSTTSEGPAGPAPQ